VGRKSRRSYVEMLSNDKSLSPAVRGLETTRGCGNDCDFNGMNENIQSL